jgi:phage shock protein C
MFCTRCGNELSERDRFCSQCGSATSLGPPAPVSSRRLTLDVEHKKIAGVCAGFARYFEVDVILVRIIWLVLAFGAGVGLLAYPIAWILMPKDEPPLATTAPQLARQHE